jgi:putative hydrolase of the HAD superfamily
MVGVPVARAVTFDLWQTLILDTPEGLRRAREERVRGIHRILQAEGVTAEVDAVSRAYDAVGERLEGVWATLADVDSHGQVRMLLEALDAADRVAGDGPVADALVEAYCRPILDALPVPNHGARETLATLHARGLCLGLICNTGRTPGRMLRLVLDRLGLSPHLAVFTFSDQLGLRKPHPEIFLRTLAALGVRPDEAVHVGDNLGADVAGARGVGMRGVHLCHPGGAHPCRVDVETIARLPDLPSLLASREP